VLHGCLQARPAASDQELHPACRSDLCVDPKMIVIAASRFSTSLGEGYPVVGDVSASVHNAETLSGPTLTSSGLRSPNEMRAIQPLHEIFGEQHRELCSGCVIRGRGALEPSSLVALPQEVVALGELIEAILARRSADQCAAVFEAAGDCEAAFGRHASEIRYEAKARLKLGYPPSLREIVGVSSLEVPMNRMLGWLFNRDSRGEAARMGLLALAELLDFPELASDIAAGCPLLIYTESSPDLEISSRQPDFLIGSPNAAALIENKVWSPESGPDQYAHYLHVLERWAGSRAARAYLLARDEGRPKPVGWERSVSHRQLADALRPLATEPSISLWDRVVYALVVSDLDPDSKSDRAREIERLVQSDHGLSEVAVATKLSQLLRHQTIDPTNGGH